MNLLNFLMMKRDPIINTITEELDLAQRSLLASQNALDWATSQVEYNRKRIDRLKAQKNELLSSNLQSRQDQLPLHTSL